MAISSLMRYATLAFVSLLVVLDSFGAPPPAPPANARTIGNLPDFPLAHLKMSLSPRLYKSLIISPVTAWVVAQVPPHGGPPKIVRSDAGGTFDMVALAMAKEWAPVGYNTIESRTQSPSLNVHLLVYKLVDALMVVNFAHNDQAFHAGIQYSDIWVGVFKGGKWTRVGGTKIIRNFPEPNR